MKSSFSWLKKPPLDIAAKVPRPVLVSSADKTGEGVCVDVFRLNQTCHGVSFFDSEKLTKASFPMERTMRARRASNGGAVAVLVGRGGAHWGNRRILSTIPNPCRSTKGVPPPWAARGGKEGEAGVKTWFRKIDP